MNQTPLTEQSPRKLSFAVENYLKAVFQIGKRTGNEWVSTGSLAEALEVSPGTVTSMLKTLDDSKQEKLIEYKPYEGVRLTDPGKRSALLLLRRHRLIELFLVKTLDLTWDQVHDEAEQMEHTVSDFLVDRMDEFLGCPETDPHGDPIPTADGELRGENVPTMNLSQCEPGTLVRLKRVANQSAEFLQYLTKNGLEIGVVGKLLENSSEAGIVSLEVEGRNIVLGQPVAEHLRVSIEN